MDFANTFSRSVLGRFGAFFSLLPPCFRFFSLPTHIHPLAASSAAWPDVAALTLSLSGMGATDMVQGASNNCALLAFTPVIPVAIVTGSTL